MVVARVLGGIQFNGVRRIWWVASCSSRVGKTRTNMSDLPVGDLETYLRRNLDKRLISPEAVVKNHRTYRHHLGAVDRPYRQNTRYKQKATAHKSKRTTKNSSLLMLIITPQSLLTLILLVRARVQIAAVVDGMDISDDLGVQRKGANGNERREDDDGRADRVLHPAQSNCSNCKRRARIGGRRDVPSDAF